MTADEKKIAASSRKLNRIIAKEWRQIKPELERCIKIGDYEAERYLRSMVFRRQQELLCEWTEWRLTLPPFVTKESGYYMKHPVTPENRHLLTPAFPS